MNRELDTLCKFLLFFKLNQIVNLGRAKIFTQVFVHVLKIRVPVALNENLQETSIV